MTTTIDWVKAGQTVVMRHSGFGGQYGQTHKIDKVYKNGNFTLEGSKDQWRPWAGGAMRTGDTSRFHRQSCVPLTDEVAAEVASSQALSKAKAVIRAEAERLDKLWRLGDDAEIHSNARLIAERMKP